MRRKGQLMSLSAEDPHGKERLGRNNSAFKKVDNNRVEISII